MSKNTVKLDVSEEQKEMLIEILSKSRNVTSVEVAENLDFHIVNELLDANRGSLHLMNIEEEELDEVFADYVEAPDEEEED